MERSKAAVIQFPAIHSQLVDFEELARLHQADERMLAQIREIEDPEERLALLNRLLTTL